MLNKFYVAGCQRSGTTMLRLILDCHPQVRCIDEAVAYDYLTKRSELDLSDITGERIFGFKIPRFTEQLIWPEMIDSHYGNFPSFYNKEKVVFIVRDVCDVVASMLTLKTGGSATWLETYAENILDTSLTHNPRYDYFNDKYYSIRSKDNYLHLLGALYWEVKNQGLIDLIKANNPVYPVSYEAMVCDPASNLRAITDFLGLPWNDGLITHHQFAHRELEDNGLAIGNTNPKRPIDQSSIGRCKSILKDNDIKLIHEFVGETRDLLNGLGVI